MPKKRYTSEKMILADIEKSRRKMALIRHQAGSKYQEAELYERGSDARNNCLNEGDKLVKKADRIQHTRLRKLGNVLSQFRTDLLPVSGMGEGHAVLEQL